MRSPFYPATWTSSGPLSPGYDACGCVFGCIRDPFRARFRFYVGDERRTFIQWSRAAEGAAYHFGQTPIHPFRHPFDYDPLGPGEVGELDSPRRDFRGPFATIYGAGVAPDATAEELAGLAAVPTALLPDGSLPPELLPPCAHPPGVALGADAGGGDAGVRLAASLGTPTDGPASAGLALMASCYLPGSQQLRASIAIGARRWVWLPNHTQTIDGVNVE